MKHSPLLKPVFAGTLFGLSVLYILRDWYYKPDRKTLEGHVPPITDLSAQWQKAASLISHRYEFGAAAVGKNIYVVGGIFQPSVWLPTNQFECYNTITNSWSELPPIPHVVHHPGVASDGTSIYVIGGDGWRIIPLGFAWRYDPTKNKWTSLPDLPTKRGALGLAHIDNKLYAIGGAANEKKYATVECFDIQTQTWSQKASMPTPREHLAMAVLNDEIHALGGYNTDRFGSLTTHEIYNPKTNTWRTAAPLPIRLCGFSAESVGDTLYIFGGEQGWAISSYVFAYRAKSDSWVRVSDLPEGRYASTAVRVDKKIYVMGGNTLMFSNKFSNHNDVFVPHVKVNS
jgi:N-acetylneuraminic acid mutarotase